MQGDIKTAHTQSSAANDHASRNVVGLNAHQNGITVLCT